MITTTNTVSPNQIAKLPFVRPGGVGSYWKGYRHIDVLKMLFEQFNDRGWNAMTSQYHLNKDKKELTATFRLDLDLPAIKDVDYAISIVTANGRRCRFDIYPGGITQNESNGFVSKKLSLLKKHTQGMELADEIGPMLDLYIKSAEQMPHEIERLQTKHLREKEYNQILLDAGRAEAMPWSRLSEVDRLWYMTNDPSCWSLLQCFATVVKQNPPQKQLEQLLKFRRLLPVKTF